MLLLWSRGQTLAQSDLPWVPGVSSPASHLSCSFPSFAPVLLMRYRRWQHSLGNFPWTDIPGIFSPALRRLACLHPTERHSRASAGPLPRASAPWIVKIMGTPGPQIHTYCVKYPVVSISPLDNNKCTQSGVLDFTKHIHKHSITWPSQWSYKMLQQRVKALEAPGPERRPERRGAMCRPEEDSVGWYTEPRRGRSWPWVPVLALLLSKLSYLGMTSLILFTAELRLD